MSKDETMRGERTMDLFAELTRDEQFALQSLLIDCMAECTKAIEMLGRFRLYTAQNDVYDVDLDLCDVFSMLNPLEAPDAVRQAGLL